MWNINSEREVSKWGELYERTNCRFDIKTKVLRKGINDLRLY